MFYQKYLPCSIKNILFCKKNYNIRYACTNVILARAVCQQSQKNDIFAPEICQFC